MKAKRKGETLIESVVSVAVFGVLLLGLMDFMTSQLNYIARLRHRDELINKAQQLTAQNAWIAIGEANSFVAQNAPAAMKKFEAIASFDWDKVNKVVTLRYDATKKQTDEIQFALP